VLVRSRIVKYSLFIKEFIVFCIFSTEHLSDQDIEV
jgi:hypothetical protein